MSILSLLYRTVGAWGAGKGSRLTPPEVDENFYAIEQAVNALIEDPTAAVNIADITVVGNQMTIIMTDSSTFGPFTLPVASLVWTGEWLPTHAYLANNLFTGTDPATGESGLYFVNRDFTSGATFVPSLGTGIGGPLPYASKLMAIPNKVRVAWFWPTQPGIGLPEATSAEDYQSMFSYMPVDAFVLPVDLVGSLAKLSVGPAFDMEFPLLLNGVAVGSVFFAAGETVGEFVFDDAVGVLPGDLLDLGAPSEVDDDAYALRVTLVGTLGELDSSSS